MQSRASVKINKQSSLVANNGGHTEPCHRKTGKTSTHTDGRNEVPQVLQRVAVAINTPLVSLILSSRSWPPLIAAPQEHGAVSASLTAATFSLLQVVCDTRQVVDPGRARAPSGAHCGVLKRATMPRGLRDDASLARRSQTRSPASASGTSIGDVPCCSCCSPCFAIAHCLLLTRSPKLNQHDVIA